MKFVVLIALLLVLGVSAKSRIVQARRVQVNQLVEERLRSFARSSHYGKSFALSKLHFEGHEHFMGSAGSEHGVPIRMDLSIRGEPRADPKWAQATTESRILKTQDQGVEWAYAEMTAIAGDYFGPKNDVKNIICPDTDLGGGSRGDDATGTRFDNAFEDIWANRNYGSDNSKRTTKANWQNYMGVDGVIHTSLLTQARNLLLKEKQGLAAMKQELHDKNLPIDNYGSAFYEKNPGSMAQTAWMVAGMVNNGYNPLAAPNLENIGNGESLAYNDDHWSDCADRTIKFGHKKAIQEAYAAGKDAKAAGTDSSKLDAARTRLIKAYGISGFTSHFLSDRFSAGHIRTPFTVLRNIGGKLLSLPGATRGASTGLTGNVMHDEDNKNCLLVGSEAAGNERWWACGDHRFFDAYNAQNRVRLHAAIEATVASIRQAFDDGFDNKELKENSPLYSVPLKHLPTTAILNDRERSENTCPLFKFENGKLWTRKGMKCLVTSVPRPAAAADHNLAHRGHIADMYGGSIESTSDPAVFPAVKSITLKNLPAVPDCEYKEVTKDDFCTPVARATVQQSIDGFTGINTCYGAQQAHLSQMSS